MERFSEWNALPAEPLEGLERRIFHGEKAMLVRNHIQPHAVLPMHSHPHEQLIYVEAGQCELTLDGETRLLTAGGLAWVPSGAEHGVVNPGEETLVALDIFAPIREDFLK